jgi:signal transduction histidine kinase/predicted ATPase
MISDNPNKKLPVEKAWVISNQLIDWLDAKHNEGLNPLAFHPGIMVWDEGNACITIPEVKILDTDTDIPPQYLSPEETGRIAGIPDYRSDYYRLGIIWYELFTGLPPFTGSDPVHIIWQHLAEKPLNLLIHVPELSSSVSAIILKLLAKNQSERYQTTESLRHDWQQAYILQQQGALGETIDLGTTDFPKYFSFPEKLIGRTTEVEQVLTTVKTFSQQARRGMLWIEGDEGSGKSFFFQQLENEIKQDNPIVIRSSCRDDDKLPYNSVKMVFEHLCLFLLNGPIPEREELTLQLQKILGANSVVLTDFVPLWEELLGRSPSAPLLGSQETQNRLAYVLSCVLAVFSKPGQSINLLLEDLHFATPQTLRLLTILLDEPQLRYFLLIVTVRSNIPGYQEMNSWLEGVLTNRAIELNRISLGAVPIEAITNFFADARIDPNIVHELASTVVRKTGGVPFFILQLMERASNNGCLSPDVNRKVWHVNLGSIAALDITENMVEYMQSKMLRLPPEGRRFLLAASTIGLSFDLGTLTAALSPSLHKEIAKTARTIHRLDIIVPESGDGYYRFSNTQLLQIAENASEETEKQEYYQRIAEYLFKQGFYLHSDSNLYRLLGYITRLSHPLPVNYITLLETGAVKAEDTGAFDAALNYYESLLGDIENNPMHPKRFHWQFKKLSMLVFSLRFKDYTTQREILLTSTTDTLQLAELDLIECKALMLKQDLNGTVHYAILSLKRLGVFFSEHPGILRIIYFLVKLKIMMRRKSIAFIESLSLSNDRRTQLIIDILQSTSSAFFLTAPKLLTEVNAWQIRSTFKLGLSGSIGQVFASYGFILSSISHNFKGAEEMMVLARNLDKRLGNVSGAVTTRFIHLALTRHWHYPIADNAALLEENYNNSRDVGAIQIAFYSLATSDIFKLYSGILLSQISQKAKEHIIACTDKKQLLMVDYERMVLQFCDNICGPVAPENFMDGEIFSASTERPALEANNYHTNLAILRSLEGLQGILFHRYDDAEKHLPALLSQISPVGFSSVSLIHAIVFQTIRAYKSKRPINRNMRSARRFIKSWAREAPFNFSVWNHLLEAIICRQAGRVEAAIYQIEHAIMCAGKYRILYAEAIACEEKAELLAEMQPDADHTQVAMQAWQLYARWGAPSLCAQLETNYPQLYAANKVEKGSGQDVDLLSLLKASNSIAGEIRWESLLEKLTTILIENAGAQTAQLLLPAPAGLQLVARKEGKAAVEFLRMPINEETHPVALLRTVWRSMTPEVVSNAAQDIRWINDSYLQKKQPLSVLCMPVIKNKGLSAIIYLENNLTTGAFTHERLDLVQLLSGQIAISLENAQLYDDLENRVEERTRQLHEKNIEIENQKEKVEKTLTDLQATQAQLIQSEKMASLGELTAGIAHEIQNPLNFVNNFSEVSNELIDEMNAEIDNGDLKEAKAIALDIKQNLEKITHHGKRADAIVKGMLQHSRSRSGIKEPTNINALADEYLRLAYHGLRAKDKSFNATLKTDFDETIEKIDIIPQDIGRVILNLITNAFYAVDEKKKKNPANYEPTVSVSTSRSLSREGRGEVLISVKDNGPGIPQQVLDKIFQPFFTTKPTGEGTGLGLSLAYDIVKAHGGELKVETKEDEGSEFIIQLFKV